MRFASGVLMIALSIFGWAKTAWQSEWNEIVEAAKREKTVVLTFKKSCQAISLTTQALIV
jgi:hypothetical protein